jgi:hypothetical protein
MFNNKVGFRTWELTTRVTYALYTCRYNTIWANRHTFIFYVVFMSLEAISVSLFTFLGRLGLDCRIILKWFLNIVACRPVAG